MLEQYYSGTTIEILYVMTFGLITLFSILAYTKKMSIGIALMSALAGIGIAWSFSPYMAIAITPIINWVIYGYAITWHTIVAVSHLGSLIAMVAIAGYNLYISGGKIVWA